MRKRFWKIEYSYTLIVIFTIILFMIPTSFSSKNARFISTWNEAYTKLDYIFTAMSAQADADIIRGLKNAQTSDVREYYMMMIAKSYLDVADAGRITKNYHPLYMNGNRVAENDVYFFENYYIHPETDIIIGIKDLENKDARSPGFIMLVDLNGIKKPNMWGKDIYGINIFLDGKITPLGYDWSVDTMKKDCSEGGTGVSCSHYYRIGGNFSE